MTKGKFVLDTNTLISAFLLSTNSTSAKAYYKAKSEGIIFFSEDTFNEFCNVFIRPKFDKYLSLSKRVAIIDDLKQVTDLTPVNIFINACRDPKDNKYLELAVSCQAGFIITGDKDLLVLHPFNGVSIITAADLLKRI